MADSTKKSQAEASSIPQWAIDCGVLNSFTKLWYALVVVEVFLGDKIPSSGEAGLASTTPKSRYIGIYLNPTDSRCYRMIARPLCLKTEDLAFNRDDDLSSAISTSIAVALVAQATRESTGLFVQSLHLGNNSMIADSVGELQLGNDEELYFHHVHLLCRGNPGRAYFEGAPVLDGPPIGVAFLAQGKGRTPEPSSQDTLALVEGLRNALADSPTKVKSNVGRILRLADPIL